ncbi:hypothetical protein J4573_18310 [Actinomadura barringtoniae]|uniref:DUF6458 domain-containing protein n=1 Tax=Actinomadura barringtoniae TaxID=1427535 RepID=A0A939T452_9ACTN|nr:DUF6458 family protein [Actinomadura barringtoniae]MBO2449063.1 hypothetical protein [Actinomadura barringtoniae]
MTTEPSGYLKSTATVRPAEVTRMGLGVSVFTITLGLILKFAIKPDAMKDPVDIHVIGVILIIVGGATFALQLLMMSRMQQRGGGGPSNGIDNSGRDRLYNGDNNPPPV